MPRLVPMLLPHYSQFGVMSDTQDTQETDAYTTNVKDAVTSGASSIFTGTPQMSTGATIVAVVIGIAIVAQKVVRFFTNDKLQILKDRAESDIIATLQTQLKDALERAERAEKERNDSAAQIGKFTAEVEAQKREIAELRKTIEAISEKFDAQAAYVKQLLEDNAKYQIENAILSLKAKGEVHDV